MNERTTLAGGSRDGLAGVHALPGPHFRQREAWERAQRYLVGLLGRVERKNGWQLAEAPTEYHAPEAKLALRVLRRQVEDQIAHADQGGAALVDVSAPVEYTGRLLLHRVNAPPEGAQRVGHIPGTQSIPWATAANPTDGTVTVRFRRPTRGAQSLEQGDHAGLRRTKR